MVSETGAVAPAAPHAGDSDRPGPLARFRLARRLMDEFAIDTGLEGGAAPRRYPWTDAFAVCNYLGLHRESGDGRDLDLALRRVAQETGQVVFHRWAAELAPAASVRSRQPPIRR